MPYFGRLGTLPPIPTRRTNRSASKFLRRTVTPTAALLLQVSAKKIKVLFIRKRDHRSYFQPSWLKPMHPRTIQSHHLELVIGVITAG
ncbi:uncharacterized protein DFL_000585 [Arthrobotrys flagrans]|uniref:Uncharacterized protein n=1 Tax=Arthrobotrys flagrans TaxID=97331 RepID=A0A437AE71_ARTFL|nr:hypothetical protein DFL_000585 [Arthrobotrys flagrans]